MVRPREKEPKHQFSVMLKPSIVAEIDKFADKYNLTRSQLMANLVETGLDDLRALNRVGIVPAVFHTMEILKIFKEKLFKGEVALTDKGEIKIKK